MDDFAEAQLIALLEVATREPANPDGTLTDATKKLLADVARVRPPQAPPGQRMAFGTEPPGAGWVSAGPLTWVKDDGPVE